MKKSFIFATMAAAVLFAGCSSSDDLASNPGEVGIPTEAENVAIEIGVGSPTSTMRGTGAVGGVSEYDENTGFGAAVTATYWAGQKINVYMLNKGTMDIAQFVKADQTTEDIYNNAVLTTPTYDGDDASDAGSHATATGVAKYIDEAAGTYQGLPFIKYYPPTGQFDFWGYRIDDAVKDGDPVVGENDIKVTFTVDGTQDVLAAQTIETFANLSDARKNAIDGANATEKEATFVATTTAGTRYSASAARKGIQPELLFKHMMTRLTFQVKAGTPSIAYDDATSTASPNPVYVTGISVRPVKTVGATIAENEYVSTKGTLTIAWKPGSEPTAENPQMAWGDAEDGETALVLKKRPNAADTGEKIENSKLVDIVDPNNTDYTTNGAVGLRYNSTTTEYEKTPIGESIIAPDAQAYEVTINLAQKLPQHETAGSTLNPGQIEADMTEMAYNTVKVVVRPSATEDHPAFLPGYSYNLLCTVYGLERIEITATLEPWKQGEEIEVIGE